jgi:hypothetical protein
MLTFNEIIGDDRGIFDESDFDKSYFVLGYEKGIFDKSFFDKSCFLLETGTSVNFEEDEKGIFDKSYFDKSYFLMDTETSVTFEWIASKHDEFELRIPRKLLTDAGITEEDKLKEVLNTVKASGIKADLTVINGDV